MQKPTIDHIINSSCAYRGTTRDQLLSALKYPEIVKTRDLVICTAVRAGHSFSSIGRALGRDHTTIIYSAKKTGATLGRAYQ